MNKIQIVGGTAALGVLMAVSGVILTNQKMEYNAHSLAAGSSTESHISTPVATSTVNLVASSSTSSELATIEEPPAPVSKPVITPVEQPKVEPEPTPEVKAPGITMAEVKTHDSRESCWTVVRNSVYDVTSFISKHPGGASKILAMCGKDSTQAFLSQHEGDRKPEAMLASFRIDDLAN